MKLFGLLALLFGILLGGFGAVMFLPMHPASALAAVFAGEEEYIVDVESGETTEHSPEEASTTATVAPSPVGALATPTSSPRSIKIPVMIYHSVRAHIPGESPTQEIYDITPELLLRELIFLRDHGYTPTTFAAVSAYFDAATPLPAKPIILSFDDGWENEYTHAFPLLKQYGMTGTFFIYTNPIDHKKPHWVTWAQVVEMDKAGMEIAGHSRTHPILTKIVTDAGLDKEITGGKDIIEKEIGHSIATFAYPFGMKDERVIAAVKRAGYTLARTTYSGVWNDPEHRFEFHGTLASDNFADFERLLNKE